MSNDSRVTDMAEARILNLRKQKTDTSTGGEDVDIKVRVFGASLFLRMLVAGRYMN